MLVSALVLGLLVAMALGSIRIRLLAAVILLIMFSPTIFNLVGPVIAGGVDLYCRCRSR